MIKFYGFDCNDKLQLHMNMFLDVAKSIKEPTKNIENVLKLMKNVDTHH